MKIAKKLCLAITVTFVAVSALPVEATTIKPKTTPVAPKTTPVVSKTTQKSTVATVVKLKVEPEPATKKVLEDKKETPKTTLSGIQFKEDEFVRITQPTFKEDMKTFESQLNIIGEARVNTSIKIKVIYSDGKFKIYEDIKPVGVTQTFNQLIDLKVGSNVIIISATHKDSPKEIPDITGKLTRESEETKEGLKTYIVQPSDILSTIDKEGSTVKKETEKTNTPINAK